jgi:hypothetical protein
MTRQGMGGPRKFHGRACTQFAGLRAPGGGLWRSKFSGTHGIVRPHLHLGAESAVAVRQPRTALAARGAKLAFACWSTPASRQRYRVPERVAQRWAGREGVARRVAFPRTTTSFLAVGVDTFGGGGCFLSKGIKDENDPVAKPSSVPRISYPV